MISLQQCEKGRNIHQSYNKDLAEISVNTNQLTKKEASAMTRKLMIKSQATFSWTLHLSSEEQLYILLHKQRGDYSRLITVFKEKTTPKIINQYGTSFEGSRNGINNCERLSHRETYVHNTIGKLLYILQ